MLVDLLKQHDVVIYNEVVLFNYVIRWLDLQKMRFQENDLPKSEMELHMKQLVETVMRYIRFPMMSPRYINIFLTIYYKDGKVKSSCSLNHFYISCFLPGI